MISEFQNQIIQIFLKLTRKKTEKLQEFFWFAYFPTIKRFK